MSEKNNIQKIVDYILANGPSTSIELKKFLCASNGKKYTRGHYSWYFDGRNPYHFDTPAYKLYWVKRPDSKWELGDGLPKQYIPHPKTKIFKATFTFTIDAEVELPIDADYDLIHDNLIDQALCELNEYGISNFDLTDCNF